MTSHVGLALWTLPIIAGPYFSIRQTTSLATKLKLLL